MQLKISKTLEAIIARTTFKAIQEGIDHSLKDRLALELLRDERSIACQMLMELLQKWELDHARTRIAQEILNDRNPIDQSAESFYRQFTEELLNTNLTDRSVTTVHALATILEDKTTHTARALEMYGVTAERLRTELQQISHTDELFTQIPIRQVDAESTKPHKKPENRLLAQFGTDLTQQARDGKIDPVVGREREIERMVQILSRRKKNNPILIGEAGVGKSALVEGLALRIIHGDVPYTLVGKRLFSLDVSSLVAGTKFRGEFEERMQQLLEELRTQQDTILFIDEIHTIVGAGSTQGSLDTANILKPALARGELQTIGATTLAEYHTCIESDAALERRFQQILVEPTSPAETLQILKQIAPAYERHHRVRYTEAALEACITLTERYLTGRYLPDKAIDAMDEAGSRAHLKTARDPETLRTLATALESTRSERHQAIEQQAYEKAGEARTREIVLQSRWQEANRSWQQSLTDSPVEIGPEEIEQVITSMTGIPAERVAGNELLRLQQLGDYLSQRVIGQQKAVETIARTIRRARAGLKAENRPIGVFLFVGPTGVGKTLLAKELSKWLFDENRGLIRLDMSEYAEKHNVARLIGSPPGYVGYGEGGQLTEAVRRQPYAVVLFDEIEKAHPELFNIMLQLFDEGQLTDGSGRHVDFRHTVVILTSNVGSRAVANRGAQVGYRTETGRQSATSDYRKALEETFAPEFLNRIDEVVDFRQLAAEDVERIVTLELESLFERTRRLGYDIKITAGAKRRLAALGYEARYGVRALKRTLTERVEDPLSALIVEGDLRTGDTVVIEAEGHNGVKLRVA